LDVFVRSQKKSDENFAKNHSHKGTAENPINPNCSKHFEHGTAFKQRGVKRGMRALLQSKSKDVIVNLLCELAAEYDLREDIFYHLENSIEED